MTYIIYLACKSNQCFDVLFVGFVEYYGGYFKASECCLNEANIPRLWP